MIPIRNSSGEKLDVTFHHGDKSDYLVILGHGLTGNKDRPLLVALAEALSAEGWPCLRMSYSGNGESEGEFVDSNITKEIGDLSAVIDQVGRNKKIAYIGHSMGGAVGALTAARDERIKVLVSLAGMVESAVFVEREFGDVVPDEGFMWDDETCPLSRTYVEDLKNIGTVLHSASDLRLPWLLLHGTADDVVLPTDSRELKKVLRGASDLVEIDKAGHSFEGHYDAVIPQVSAWLGKYL